MWCVIVSGLPLGVTPSALQRACEEALNDRPVWPQSPKISEGEALVYLQARDLQQKLSAKNTKLRVGGIIVNVQKVNKEQAEKWVNDRKPKKKKNPAPGSNIHQHIKRQKKEQRKINKRKLKEQQQLQQKKGIESLYDRILLDISDDNNPNKIIWYQYLIFDKYTNSKPFHVTYPALWSWDIEGQWIKFQQEYAMNSSEAEKNHSKFKIGEPGDSQNSHKMIGDLLNMKVTDTVTNNEYDLKRTDKLIGTLINYGQIEFIRYHNTKEKEIFLYDRKNGYNDIIDIENECKELEIGDRVIFESYWNRDENDNLIHDIPNLCDINKIQLKLSKINNESYDYIIHDGMIAYNVRKSSPEDEEIYAGSSLMDNYQFDDGDSNNMNDNDLDKQLNPLLPDSTSYYTDYADIVSHDPLIAEDFRGQRFEGLVISLRKDDTGLIVCFPYNNNKDMTLLFHKRFLKSDNDKLRLTVNMNVEFKIGVHPGNFGQGLYGYVAQDIIITKHGFSNKFMPISDDEENKPRLFRGKIVISPKECGLTKCGWIYNEFNNNMCALTIKSDEEKHDYRVGIYVRYNEKKQKVEQQQKREDYIYNAYDILPIERFEEKIITQYLRSDNFVKYKAKRYIFGRKLKIDEDRNIEFKIVKINKENKYDYNNYTDFFLIIEQAELYVNAFLNTCGGAIFFGIKDNGQIIGQNNMTKNKRDYIRNAIGQRLHHFKPSVPSEYYKVEFKEIIDKNGYIIPNTYIIIIHVAKLFAGDNIKQHVKFLTSQGEAYERRITSVGFSKSKELTHLKPQEHQQLYNKRKAKGITREVNFGVKPQFNIFDDIDDDENEEKLSINNDEEEEEEDNMLATYVQEANKILPSNQIIIRDADEGKGQFETILGQENNVEITAQISTPTIGITQQQQQQHSQSSMSDIMGSMASISLSSPSSSVSNINIGGMNTNNVNMIAIPEPLKYTTAKLNELPIPENTTNGLMILQQRVQQKLNEMMMVTDYMLDPKWNTILTMAANTIYPAQRSTWVLLCQLEREKIQKRTIEIAKAHQQRALIQRQKQQQQQQQQNMMKATPIIAKPATYADRIARSSIMVGTNTTLPTTTDNSIESKRNNDCSTNIDGPTIGEQYKKNFSGSGLTEPATDKHGLPILPDKSKYKAVAMEYCQKMGWKRPVEAAQMYGAGYRATVTFGRHGKEKSESGDGLKQKSAIYEAYIKLIPKVIPKSSAIELMIKWVPGYKKADKVSTATIGQSGQSIMKHPKSVLLEWAQKNSIAPPKTVFSEFADSTRNLRIWTAKVTFCGKTIEAKGAKKKDAESKCFQEILKHVMNGGIKSK